MADDYTDSDVAQVASDLSALQDAGYDTSDAGRGNKAMTEGDVASETGSNSTDTTSAAHTARDDMAAAGDQGIPADRHSK